MCSQSEYTYENGRVAEETPREQHAGFDRDRREFFAVAAGGHVAHRVHVRNVRAVLLVHQQLAVAALIKTVAFEKLSYPYLQDIL